MKRKIIKLIKNADISDADWVGEVLGQVTDKYARGYLQAKVSGVLRIAFERG